MSKLLHPLTLFRLTVLGGLASRNNLQRGEIKKLFVSYQQILFKCLALAVFT